MPFAIERLPGFQVDGTWNVPTTLTFVGCVHKGWFHLRSERKVMTKISAKIKNCDLPKMQPVSDVKRRLIARVMQQTDDLVIVIEYEGKDGSVTRRVVSPIRFVGKDRFLALCLSREEPRQFYIDRCRSVRVDLAGNYIMPVEMMTLAS